ncbi:hypothetical protein EVAR_62697_1 [Eumeta japonica]|uniref:Uncharacterized protein n=1 Tax=Eumeta variegata TaxID=151549 RepID=A0A4C1ZL45_EUMVA|nr:hypothetical protein EVAR_62697_1 [Eumeta japonica]
MSATCPRHTNSRSYRNDRRGSRPMIGPHRQGTISYATHMQHITAGNALVTSLRLQVPMATCAHLLISFLQVTLIPNFTALEVYNRRSCNGCLLISLILPFFGPYVVKENNFAKAIIIIEVAVSEKNSLELESKIYHRIFLATLTVVRRRPVAGWGTRRVEFEAQFAMAPDVPSRAVVSLLPCKLGRLG